MSQAILEWDELERAFRGIFSRRYFANNGPLVQQLDRTFAEMQGGGFAVAVASEWLAYLLAAKALAPRGGRALVSVFADSAVVGALSYAGFECAFVDVDATSLDFEADGFERNAAGCDLVLVPRHVVAAQGAWSRCALPVIRNVSDCARAAPLDGCTGIFSLSDALSATSAEGALVSTADEEVSKQLRTMRNFHAGETFADVPLRINAKMSEAQAAVALCFLTHAGRARAATAEKRQRVAAQLRVAGVRLIDGAFGDARLVIAVEARRRSDMIAVLKSVGVEAWPPFAVPQGRVMSSASAALNETLLEVSLVSDISADAIARLGEMVRHA